MFVEIKSFPEGECLDGSAHLLDIFDGKPKTYKDWAEEYFDEVFENRSLELDLVVSIYKGDMITKEMVKKINPELDDFEQLEVDLDGIGCEYQIE